ncbi:MAG TPA: SagB/ThcOx family dehydrogenase [Phycisphaerae bacterium]|nr:SagB/ThcOx family dehydrogenase [Phycisphaerae bacterium]
MKLAAFLSFFAALAMVGGAQPPAASRSAADDAKALPSPQLAGPMSLEETLVARRSVRQFTGAPLTLDQISQLCWAGQGITEPKRGLRTAPSAGALYPIELYIVTADGVDHYLPDGHKLERHVGGDLRPALKSAANDQESIGQAGTCVVITAVMERTSRKYGERAERFCYVEAGHVGQNILLQATSLNLAGVPMGAFDDDKVAAALKLPKDRRVLYLVAIGHPRK